MVASNAVPLALTGYETGLLASALVFIFFALVVALVVPRSRPEFPSKYLGWFIAACIVLFAVQMTAVILLAELGEEEHAEVAEETEPAEPTEPSPTEPAPTTEDGDDRDGADRARGDGADRARGTEPTRARATRSPGRMSSSRPGDVGAAIPSRTRDHWHDRPEPRRSHALVRDRGRSRDERGRCHAAL